MPLQWHQPEASTKHQTMACHPHHLLRLRLGHSTHVPTQFLGILWHPNSAAVELGCSLQLAAAGGALWTGAMMPTLHPQRHESRSTD
jgi:hypothetical protein